MNRSWQEGGRPAGQVRIAVWNRLRPHGFIPPGVQHNDIIVGRGAEGRGLDAERFAVPFVIALSYTICHTKNTGEETADHRHRWLLAVSTPRLIRHPLGRAPS